MENKNFVPLTLEERENLKRTQPAPAESSPQLTEDAVASARHQVVMAGKANGEVIEWLAKESIPGGPFEDLGTMAALIDFGLKTDPDKITIMWAEAIFRLAEQKGHSNE